MPAKLRAGVIGATGKGNYGHGLDAVFSKLDGVGLIALADENEPGRAAAGKRLGVSRLHADYREMLKAERLNLVSVCPRWVDQRLAMVRAAAEAGCHVYCEKPLAGDLVAGDALLEACRKAGTQASPWHISSGPCLRCARSWPTCRPASSAKCCECGHGPRTTAGAAARS